MRLTKGRTTECTVKILNSGFERESLSDDELVTEVSLEWAAFDVTGWKKHTEMPMPTRIQIQSS